MLIVTWANCIVVSFPVVVSAQRRQQATLAETTSRMWWCTWPRLHADGGTTQAALATRWSRLICHRRGLTAEATTVTYRSGSIVAVTSSLASTNNRFRCRLRRYVLSCLASFVLSALYKYIHTRTLTSALLCSALLTPAVAIGITPECTAATDHYKVTNTTEPVFSQLISYYSYDIQLHCFSSHLLTTSPGTIFTDLSLLQSG